MVLIARALRRLLNLPATSVLVHGGLMTFPMPTCRFHKKGKKNNLFVGLRRYGCLRPVVRLTKAAAMMSIKHNRSVMSKKKT